ncbi:MAG: precorrin-6A reductase [Clostridiales bacterium]|nr:precorrin-6A reductase [Clostridiales bacterium]
MTEVLIFGGTTEGRKLALCAVRLGLRVLVSVTSEYGRAVMEDCGEPEFKGEGMLRVRCGALDEPEMAALILEETPRLVLDATHPHAALASRSIAAACRATQIECLRVLRESAPLFKADNVKIFRAETAGEAAEILETDREPVLLVTGSKELPVFAGRTGLAGRLYARVLPDSHILAECEALGLRGSHLIAMQGPFSTEMNRALLRQTGARWLVTKESGKSGGFAEKLAAAADCGCRVIVIERPVGEQGISMDGAEKRLRELSDRSGRYRMSTNRTARDKGTLKENADTASEGKSVAYQRTITIVGLGMGGGRQLTLEALDALRRADVVFGARRMLDDVREWTNGKRTEPLYQRDAVISWLKSHPDCDSACMVCSGDTGFYSAAATFEKKMTELPDWKLVILPGISAMSALCARLQRPWETLRPVSLHGRDCDVESLLQSDGPLFLLLGGETSLGSLCARLKAHGLGDTRIDAGVCLGYPLEELLHGRVWEFTGRTDAVLAAVILERDDEQRPEGDDQ